MGIGTLIVFIAMVLVAAIAAGVLINTAGFLQTQAEATGEESASQVSDRIEVQSATGLVGGFDDSDEIESSEGQSDLRLYGVDLTVTQAPGSDDIDLDDVTAELITDEGVEQIVLGDGVDDPSVPLEDADAATADDINEIGDIETVAPVYVDSITESGDDNVITDSSDRYQIRLAGYALEEEGEDDVFYSFRDVVPTDDGISNDVDEREGSQAWAGDLEGGDTMEIRLTTASGATTIEEVRVPDSLIDRDAVAL
nr:archaellin/type IV pilin N-terminal domain-containing protein [Halorubrum vacuolatum]